MSGVAGLIYEIVWMRMLIRVFGITLHATSTIIAVYMGGLALGSWLFGKFSLRRPYGLKTYGYIEVGIAATALIAALGINLLPGIYASLISPLVLDQDTVAFKTLIRVGLSAVCMIVPTMLMGSTLPLLTRIITETHENIGSRLAKLYGINTLGAVIGILAAGFVLIAAFGEIGTILIAAGFDLIVGLVLIYHPKVRGTPIIRPPEPAENRRSRLAPDILAAAALSGFCAIALEVLWTRILILLLGTSVYAFSMMLALYLFGIGIGSILFKAKVDAFKKPFAAFAFLQAGVAVLGILSLSVYRYFGLAASGANYLYSPLNTAGDIGRLFGMAFVIIVPVTILYGMIFPLLGRLLTRKAEDSGHSVGSLYAWNTVGGICGSILTVFVLIPLIGTQATFSIVCFLNFILGLAVFIVKVRPHDSKGLIGLGAVGLASLLLLPKQTNIYLEILNNRLQRFSRGEILFHEENIVSTLTGYQRNLNASEENKVLLINGIIISGKGSGGAAGKLMAHIPLLFHQNPKRALTICFGAGNTYRATIDHLGSGDAVELVEGVVRNNSFFYDDSDSYVNNPGSRIFINDGRNHMLISKDRYDVIVIDASPPIFSEGTVNLYSEEFLRMVKEKLSPGGIVHLWVPVPCFEDDFWMIARNFTGIYPHLFIYTHPELGGVMLMGSDREFDTSRQTFARRMRERRISEYAPWLPEDIIQRGWSLNDRQIRAYAANYDKVTDNNPRTEFPLRNFAAGKTFWKGTHFIQNAMRSQN